MTAKGVTPANADQIIADGADRYADLAGDKRGRNRLAYCLTVCPDGFAFGNWTTFDNGGHSGKWHSRESVKAATPEERAEFKRRIKQAEADREARLKTQHEAKAKDAQAVWSKAGPASAEHPYLIRKGVKTHGARQQGDNLILQGVVDGKIWTYQSIDAEGEKLFFSGGRKKGCYYPITTKDESKAVILICEGFATAASIREAVNLPVIAAFDAGNLLPVALEMRRKYPEAKILICADNDTTSYGGNVGRDKAEQAAVRVQGASIWPEFPDDNFTDTDFNDLHKLLGLEAVKIRIEGALSPQWHGAAGDLEQLTPALMQLPPPHDLPVSEPDYRDYSPDVEDTEEIPGDFGLPFKILGYNNGDFYYYPFGEKQILALSASAHTLNNIMRLCGGMDKLQGYFGGMNVSMNQMVTKATDAFFQTATKRGVFVEAESVRGVGAWLDAGRVVLHCGDVLYCDGKKTDMNKFLSGGYTYVASQKLMTPTQNPLTSKEANRLRDICEAVTWENKLSGSLLAGWLVIAPLCGVLAWRPHIWITGEAESGKSTVMKKIIRPVLGKMALERDGGTSEPDIREKMGYSARPLFLDEAEKSADGKSYVMESVIELARKASSGAIIGKFGQRPFKAQFTACFSSIRPPVSQPADIGRISFLSIVKNKAVTAQDDYNALLAMIDEVITPDFSSRLLDRTLENLPTLLENIKVFTVAARTVLKAARAADQIGPMLAGLYLLSSTKKISVEDAEAWVRKHDWTSHTNIGAESDAVRLLRIIFTSVVKVTQTAGNMQSVTIGEMISASLYGMDGEGVIGKADAERTLRQHGIIAQHDGIYIANNSDELARLIAKSGFILGMGKWGAVLKDLDGVTKAEPKWFTPGDKQRASVIPLSYFSVESTPRHTEVDDEVLL